MIAKIKLKRPTQTKNASASLDGKDTEGDEDETEDDEGDTEDDDDDEEEDEVDDPDDEDYTGRPQRKKPAKKKKMKKKSVMKEKKEKKQKEFERTFCASEYREEIVAMVERHFCSHPLIPGIHGTDPKAIHYWATKKLYNYCVERELVEVWAYLWVNWYRPSRWRLWARAECSEIPRLKTTMICESQ